MGDDVLMFNIFMNGQWTQWPCYADRRPDDV